MDDLRAKLIKLSYEKPELRGALLPLLRKQADSRARLPSSPVTGDLNGLSVALKFNRSAAKFGARNNTLNNHGYGYIEVSVPVTMTVTAIKPVTKRFVVTYLAPDFRRVGEDKDNLVQVDSVYSWVGTTLDSFWQGVFELALKSTKIERIVGSLTFRYK